MPRNRTDETPRSQRVFGFFVFVVAVGLAYSLTASPQNGARKTAERAARQEADEALAYAACQAKVRDRVARDATLRFPDDVENFGDEGTDRRLIVARVVVNPIAGSPFAQRFACRLQHLGAGPASIWRVSHLSLDAPVS